jgi:hypothetical protein
LTLENISNAPPSGLRGGYGYPEKEKDEIYFALRLTTPIVFSLGNIRDNHSSCGICDLLHQQLDETLYVDKRILEAYLCRERVDKIYNLWFYVQGSRERVARLDLYGQEG